MRSEDRKNKKGKNWFFLASPSYTTPKKGIRFSHEYEAVHFAENTQIKDNNVPIQTSQKEGEYASSISATADFDNAYAQYADAIFHHCFFRILDRERALEIMQETFMRAWNYLSQGKKIMHFRSFLYWAATPMWQIR
ncbi:MAG: RNA polymerase, sigma-24 subunit, ECF subfamily [Parcubacteria group bacterium Gr01-1014_66]|nr:MAG: RNA polymerase, sigma-24 subunit, ECF subfamily [Parcubacteria group bacterium Gr01-1014_66]